MPAFAEDSTPYQGVTKAVWEGGLGFDYKWDLGWMHDTLSYFQADANERREKYHKLTFSMMYYYNERYILPLSHDEVVHGKATIAQKMNGGYDGKFPQARAFYMYMYAHPGAKLNFMGNELAQLKEWCEKDELDWILLKFPIHEAFHKFMADLNKCYLTNNAFYQRDIRQDGFEWVDCHQEQKCMYLFERISGDQKILAVFNFSDETQEYTLEKDYAGYELLLASDMVKYGGKSATPRKRKKSRAEKRYSNGTVFRKILSGEVILKSRQQRACLKRCFKSFTKSSPELGEHCNLSQYLV